MTASPRSFGRFVLRGFWFPLVLAAAATAVTVFSLVGAPPTYVCQAKVVAGGDAIARARAIETFESRELHQRAEARARVFVPAVKDATVEVRAARLAGSGEFDLIIARGHEREFTQAFLNALIDEVRAFSDSKRKQQHDKAAQSLAADVAKCEEAAKKAAEQLSAYSQANHVVLLISKKGGQAESLKSLRFQKAAIQAAAATASVSEVEKAAEQQRLVVLDRQLEALNQEISDTDQKLGRYDQLKTELAQAEDRLKAVAGLQPKDETTKSPQDDGIMVVERASKVAEERFDPMSSILIAALGGLVSGTLLLCVAAAIRSSSGPQPTPAASAPVAQ